MLRLGDTDHEVLRLKALLNKHGYDLTPGNSYFGTKTDAAVRDFQSNNGLKVDGQVGPLTWAALEGASRPSGNPAYKEAKKHAGKTEHDPKFNKYLSGFWKIVGLPNYKTIIGSSFAWCGLFIAVMNSETGLSWIRNGAGAKNWAKYAVEIEWKKDGIPAGAVMHINGNGNCSSGKGNHVTFADGDCTVADLNKSGLVPGFGGNQASRVKRSMYPVKNLCAVRWPAEIEKPGKILKSVNCAGKSSGDESTR